MDVRYETLSLDLRLNACFTIILIYIIISILHTTPAQLHEWFNYSI